MKRTLGFLERWQRLHAQLTKGGKQSKLLILHFCCFSFYSVHCLQTMLPFPSESSHGTSKEFAEQAVWCLGLLSKPRVAEFGGRVCLHTVCTEGLLCIGMAGRGHVRGNAQDHTRGTQGYEEGGA